MSANYNNRVDWEKIIRTSGKVPESRHGHRSVVIENDIIVFGGGKNSISNGIYKYDTVRNRWSEIIIIPDGNVPASRASFGCIVQKLNPTKHRIVIFGGMVEYRRYSNELFLLECEDNNWKWICLTDVQGDNVPTSRIGHSFTLVNDKIYLFGGLIEPACYVNDLYSLEISEDNNAKWTIPITHGIKPSPRESHTCISYKDPNTNEYKLVIFGGTDSHRLGDVHILNLDTHTWIQPQINGKNIPLARSLHSSVLVGNKMYIFGGWVPIFNQLQSNINPFNFKCTNTLHILNLETMCWENVNIYATGGKHSKNETIPRPRSGHSAIVLHSRMYVWSGRNGFQKNSDEQQACFNDLWVLDVGPPSSAPTNIVQTYAGENSIELTWSSVLNAKGYIIQIKKIDQIQALKHTSTPKIQPNTTTNKPMVQKPFINASVQQTVTKKIVQIPVIYENPQARYTKIVTPKLFEPVSTKEAARSVIQVKSSTPPFSNATIPAQFVLTNPTVPPLYAAIQRKELNKQIVSQSDNKNGPPRLIQNVYVTKKIGSSNGSGYTFFVGKGNVPSTIGKSTNNASSTVKSGSFKNLTQVRIIPKNTSIQQPTVNDLVESSDKNIIHTEVNEKEQNSIRVDEPMIKSPVHDDEPMNKKPKLQDNENPQNSLASATTNNIDDTNELEMNRWCDVYLVKGTNYKIVSYYEPDDINVESSLDKIHIRYCNTEQIEKVLKSSKKENIVCGTQYLIRIAGVNGCGRGPWSQSVTFETRRNTNDLSAQGFQIYTKPDVVYIKWNHPIKILSPVLYTAYLAVDINQNKKEIDGFCDGNLYFCRVYHGSNNSCCIKKEMISRAHKIETDNKKTAILFRIKTSQLDIDKSIQIKWILDP